MKSTLIASTIVALLAPAYGATLITMYDMEGWDGGKPVDSEGKNYFIGNEWTASFKTEYTTPSGQSNNCATVSGNKALWSGTTNGFTTNNFAVSFLIKPDILPISNNEEHP